MTKQHLLLTRVIISCVCSLAVLTNPASAQTNFTALKSFAGPDGSVPAGSLVYGNDGAFYGTTAGGGISNAGTVFKLNQDGSGFVTLKSFVGSDGAAPYAGLVLSTNGCLFGTTYGGGLSNFGTVFKIARDGTGFSVLHSFTGAEDSKNPGAALIEGSDGALYGTTPFGNSATRGTIFKIQKDGNGYLVLHSFTGNPDGQQPQCKLLEGSDGALYGTASFGGPTVRGTVFTLQKDGSGYSTIYNFQNSADGSGPGAGLVEGSNGALYGTTSYGGTDNCGTIFKMNKDGSGHTVLRSFLATGGDGQRPNGELIEGADGALYGGTEAGGAGYGTFYTLNKYTGGYSILRSFAGTGGDANSPRCALVQLNNDVLYGTTEFGGHSGGGCVFALSTVPLPPRVLSMLEALSG